MLAIVQLSDVLAHVCPPDASVTLDIHVVSQSEQHLRTREEVRAYLTGSGWVSCGMGLPSESVLLTLWLGPGSGPGFLWPTDRNYISRSPGFGENNNFIATRKRSTLPGCPDTAAPTHRRWPSFLFQTETCAHQKETLGGRPEDTTVARLLLCSYWAMTSRPLMICLMALCWMADGFSKPERGDMYHLNGVWVGSWKLAPFPMEECDLGNISDKIVII